MKHISSCNTITAGLCLDGGSFFLPVFISVGTDCMIVLEGTGCFTSVRLPNMVMLISFKQTT
jgi:hypothetical protein